MADDDLIERTGTIDGKPFKVKVSKTLTDDEVKRRVAAQRMQPSQTDFGTDVGYGIMEGVGAIGARQLGEEIAKRSGVIPQAPAAPGAGQEGVVTEAKVPSGKPEGLTAGRLLGNIMGGAGAGGAIGKGMEALGVGSSLARNLTAGGVVGGLQPVDETKDFWKTKAKQAGTGIGLGFGFSVAGKAANVGTSALLKWLAPRAPGSTEDVAIAEIIDRINSDSKYGGATAMHMMELMERLQAQGKPMTLSDVGGKNLQGLAGVVSRTPGSGAKQLAENFLTQRDDAAFERLMNDVGVYVKSGPTARATINGLYRSRSAASTPLYEQTDALQGIWSPELRDRFLQGPARRDFQAGLNRGYRIEAREAATNNRPFDPTQMGVDLDDEGNVLIRQVPNMRVLDMAKQGLDAMIAEHRDNLTGRLDADGRSLANLKKAYVDLLDRLDPTGVYKKARETWGGISASMDAVKLGQSAFAGHPEEMTEELAAMSQSDREFARIGLADTMRERLMKAGLGTDESRALLKDNQWTKMQLKPFFRSEQEYYDFVDAVSAEHTMAATKNSILKGSQSAERIGEDISQQSGHLARGARIVKGAVEGRLFDTLREMWLLHRDYSRRPDPNLNEAIAKMLFAPNVFQTPLGQRLLAQSGLPKAMQNYLAGTPSRVQDVMEPALTGGTAAEAADVEGKPGKHRRSVVREPELQ